MKLILAAIILFPSISLAGNDEIGTELAKLSSVMAVDEQVIPMQIDDLDELAILEEEDFDLQIQADATVTKAFSETFN